MSASPAWVVGTPEHSLLQVRETIAAAFGRDPAEGSATEWAVAAADEIRTQAAELHRLRGAPDATPTVDSDAVAVTDPELVSECLAACLVTLDALGVPLEGSLFERLAWVRGRGLRGPS